MYSHSQRLELLSKALGVARDRVVPVLRSKPYQYYDASGTLVFDGEAAWPDHQFIKAAFDLFIVLEPSVESGHWRPAPALTARASVAIH